MKRKIVPFFLVFVFTFSIVSNSYQKKVNAFATTLVFTAGVSMMAVAPVMQMLYANGMLMPMGDMISYVTNMFYDKSGENYVAKAGQVSLIDKLEYYTSALLTGNQMLDKTELRQEMEDFISKNVPKNFSMNDISLSSSIGEKYGIPYTHKSQYWNGGIGSTNQDNTIQVSTATRDRMYLIQSGDIEYFVKSPRIPFEYGYTMQKVSQGGVVYENVKVIFPNLTSIYLPVNQINSVTYIPDNILEMKISIKFDDAIKTISDYFTDLIERGEEYTDKYVPESYLSTDNLPFVLPSLNWYGALNGKASTVDDLKGLINTDEYLQLEILNLLQNQAVNTENDIQEPTVGTDGKLYYPDNSIPDNPDVPYVPGAAWYDNILDGVTSIPDLFIGKMTDLIDDKITPALESLKNTVLSIPDLITNIWQWILDFPDLLYSWFVPTAPMIAETWDPVMDLWDLKLDPIIAPFKTLTFYETEYQDISVPLKFGSYEKEHKIIDFQYIKSQRDTIKSLIRAFLWILIIFFNLDQIHRLIRNQSLLNTYVRKIDKGA